MPSLLFLDCNDDHLSTIDYRRNSKDLRMRTRLRHEKLIERTAVAELSGGYKDRVKGQFIFAARRTVSVIDHKEIVREDLSGRSALAAVTPRTTRIFS